MKHKKKAVQKQLEMAREIESNNFSFGQPFHNLSGIIKQEMDSDDVFDPGNAMKIIKKITLTPKSKKREICPKIEPLSKYQKSKCLINLQGNLNYLQNLSAGSDEIIAKLESENMDLDNMVKDIEGSQK